MGILHSVAFLVSLASILLFSGCDRDVVMRIKGKYPLGLSLSELALDPEHIIFDLRHPSARPVALIVGMKGYKQPKRVLNRGERVVAVAEELDLVSYLFFCADERLCDIEVLGS